MYDEGGRARAGPAAIEMSYLGLPALIVSASSRYRAPASGAQPFAFDYDGVSLRVRERDKERGKNEPPSPSTPRPVQHPETAFRTQQDDGGLPYGHRWSFRLQAPERREGTLLLGRPLAAPLRGFTCAFSQSSRSLTGFPRCFSRYFRGNKTPKLFNKTGHYSHARLWLFVKPPKADIRWLYRNVRFHSINNRHATPLKRCPILPQYQTSVGAAVTSASCQLRTHASRSFIRYNALGLGDMTR